MTENNPPYIRFQGEDLAYYGELYPFLKDKIYTKWENTGKYYRLYPRDFVIIMEEAAKYNCAIKTSLPFSLPEYLLPQSYLSIKLNITLLTFQLEALKYWKRNRFRGIIVLPTGSGKTVVACGAIESLKITTLIIVPTIVLMEQWRTQLINILGLTHEQIGIFGGGNHDVKPITVSTFESAQLYQVRFRSQFGLLIVDEAHNLTGTNYEKIADGYLSPYRLALTATLSPRDSSFKVLTEKGFEKIVYQVSPKDLEDIKILAPYKIVTIKLDRLKNEHEYKENMGILRGFFHKYGIYGIDAFEKLRFMVNRNQDAYYAMQAFHKAKKIAFSAEEKLDELEKILIEHSNDKMIIFSDLIDFCERIGREFLIPVLTHRTKKDERQIIMSLFRDKPNAKVCVGKIFDEGIDVPSARIGVIISGSSQNRQFVQRLGRLLRRESDEKEAILYELVSKNTLEMKFSSKRKSFNPESSV